MTARTVRTLLAVLITAAWVLPTSVPGLAHETGPDTTHSHPTDEEREQGTSEHTEVCVEMITTLDWETFSGDSDHAYTGAFDQYSDEMQAMMRLRGTYEECKVLLEPVKRRQIQEWLVGDAESGSWVSTCGGNDLPTGFEPFYRVWQNGHEALNPETCQRVADLLNEVSEGLGNDGLWRARIADLVEDALTSRCSDNIEGPYEQQRCRGTATSASTILNCLDTIVDSLPEDDARERIHDLAFGIGGSNPPDNSGLCSPSFTAQPVHEHGDTDATEGDTESVTDEGDTESVTDEGDTESVTDEGDTESVTDEGDTESVTDEGDTESVTDEGDTESVTDEGDTESVTDEGDTESVTDEGDTESVTDEGDTESVTDEGDTESVTDEGDTESVTDEGDTDATEPSLDDELAGLDLPERVRNAYQGAINAYRARGCTVEVIQSTVTGRYRLRTSCPDR